MAVDNLLGRQLDEYRIDRLLGYGGMGRVYLATDVRLQRQVAIKVMMSSFHADPEYAARFKREALAIARLEHPHIVRLYRYGEVKGLVYMAMQYIEGSDLATMLAAYRKARDYVDLKDTSQIVQDICSALDYAHRQGVIHRDVKPSNILLDAQGRAYLADFGLARLANVSTRGTAFGSAHYMSPEQAILSSAVVPQSDLYSMGIVLYEMLTGKVPFDAELPSDIVMQHLEESPRPPRRGRTKIGPELEAVVMTALAKKPEDRHPNGAALAANFSRAVKVTLARSPSDSPTRLSRSSIAQRIREAEVKPMPPIPAAVAAPSDSISVPAPGPVPEPAPPHIARFSKGRRLLVYALSVIALLAGLIAAAVLVDPFGHDDDKDHDGFINGLDNCVQVTNPDQLDSDGNGVGDACQDSDGDNVIDTEDTCPDEAGLAVTKGCTLEGTVTAQSNVNMRAGPGMNYDVRGVLHPGEGVVILGRNDVPVSKADDIWLQVRPLRLDAEDAWVSYALIKMDVSAADLPVVAP